jgi:transposase InsO family protein
MVWTEKTTVSLRQEFVSLARQADANVRALCRRFGINPKTGYKWLQRSDAVPGQHALHDRSRRPHTSPTRSSEPVERAVLAMRHQHPSWGGRKIARRLHDLGQAQLAPSTVTHILHRHGLISAQASEQARPWQRFEHEAPNCLWQMDFKGHFPTLAGPCHALTLLDDHSRFNLLLSAQARTRAAPVQTLLIQVFRRYGLPLRINTDNGPPWGSPSAAGHSLSELAVWLIRLGVRVSFSAPYHPQTNGKIERFHRTLQGELLTGRHFADHDAVQRHFDAWRAHYNGIRPHQALDMGTPLQRYRISELAYPERLGPIDYPDTDQVVTVGWNGFIRFQGRRVRLSSALHRLPVGIRPHPLHDGLYEVYFCHQRFTQIDLRQNDPHAHH